MCVKDICFIYMVYMLYTSNVSCYVHTSIYIYTNIIFIINGFSNINTYILYTDPWEHVLMFGAGGLLGWQLEKYENEKRDALQSLLMETNKFGLPDIAKKKMAQQDDE